ncbi:hypothetical protein GGX14DRAFT_554267 [Mycena pura]|uniref:Uncharacterized protein n=1 Tax=Mycena pura TaxID=153505 RepID=A0AAD7E4W0_9AGAR|nr:hypothetical protein GGX14DRAFT_554267 [Mycena pura]
MATLALYRFLKTLRACNRKTDQTLVKKSVRDFDPLPGNNSYWQVRIQLEAASIPYITHSAPRRQHVPALHSAARKSESRRQRESERKFEAELLAKGFIKADEFNMFTETVHTRRMAFWRAIGFGVVIALTAAGWRRILQIEDALPLPL